MVGNCSLGKNDSLMAIVDDYVIFFKCFTVHKQLRLNNGLCVLVANRFDPWFTFMNICLAYLLIGLMYKETTVARPLYGFFGC